MGIPCRFSAFYLGIQCLSFPFRGERGREEGKPLALPLQRTLAQFYSGGERRLNSRLERERKWGTTLPREVTVDCSRIRN